MKNGKDQGGASSSRRDLLKGFSLLPVAATTIGAQVATQVVSAGVGQADASPIESYKPTFFNADEWAFVVAAADRLIPHDETGPGAVELGAPEFIDRHMQSPYANGAIWYMQGPYKEAGPEFGYQGRLPLRDILRVGIKATDDHCRAEHGGKAFAQLDHATQEAVLKGLESGQIKLEGVPARQFFAYFLGEVRNGYFCDPGQGGNRGMGSWKMIGYPGMRADYADWVEVRDRPYPLGPVDLSGRRG